MPTRIIRESMLDSHRYASLGDPAKLLFVHILLLADDFGCVTVTPTFLRRRAFFNSPSNEHIAKLLAELVDADLLRPYQHDGGEYAFVPRFRQRLQRTTLRHPQPPSSLLHGDDDAINKFNKINGVTKNTTVPKPLPTVGQQHEVEVEVEVKVPKDTDVVGKDLNATRAKRGSRMAIESLPDDWRTWATANRLDLNPDAVFAEFRDYWIAQPGAKGVKLDWMATWRNWVRNQRATPTRTNGAPQRQSSATMRAIASLDSMLSHNRNPQQQPPEKEISDETDP